MIIVPGLSKLLAQNARDYFQNDRVLSWKTSSQGGTLSHGELRISNVNNNSFDAAQSNKNNPGAGTQTLYGGIFNGDQQVVLLNVGEFREVWVGAVSGDRIVGKIEGTNIDFEIRQRRAIPLRWVAYNGMMPAKAVSGGSENGSDLIVCRTFYKGANHPGKVVTSGCNIGWGGSEIVSETYEVLINEGDLSLQWVPYNGSIPSQAVIAGMEGSKPYYVGQFTRADGSIHAGKVFGMPGNYILNYGYAGKEVTEPKNFRILVQPGVDNSRGGK